jgi:two-component system, OmpR family, response regulator
MATSGEFTRVLVVDDEENIAYLVSSAMRNQGFTTKVSRNGSEAISLARSFNPHLIILDVMLPDISGTDVLRQIRNQGIDTPVIFLSALGSTTDKVSGLTVGGDDYIVKPFVLEELTARSHALLRRAGLTVKPNIIEIDSLVIDVEAHRVWRNQVESHLSATEFNLLHYLASNVGKVMSRSQILDHVWHYDFDGDSSIIEAVVSNIRKKIDHAEPRLIHTVRGVGYTMRSAT